MKDQAEGLRKIVNKKHLRFPRIIAVTSGKGGVGKTNVSVNLAISLIKHKQHVALLDADLGLANADILLGVYPKYTLWHVLRGEKQLSDIIAEGPMGLKIIAGSSGIYELANLNHAPLEQFINSIKRLADFDFLIIDTSAGLNRNLIKFLLAVNEILIIATPEPSSIADAYGLIKTIVQRDPKKKIMILANMVRSPNEGKLTWQKINIVTKKFLDYEVKYIGCILHDAKVVTAINDQEPFVLAYPASSASRSIEEIARKILTEDESGTKSAENRGFNGITQLKTI